MGDSLSRISVSSRSLVRQSSSVGGLSPGVWLLKVVVETGVEPLRFNPGISRIHNASRHAHSRNLFLGEQGDPRRSHPEPKERVHRDRKSTRLNSSYG